MSNVPLAERESRALWGIRAPRVNRGTDGRWAEEHPKLAAAMRRVAKDTASARERAIVNAWCEATVRAGLGLPDERGVVVLPETDFPCGIGDCKAILHSAAALGSHRHYKHPDLEVIEEPEPVEVVPTGARSRSGEDSPPSLEPGRPPLVLVRWRDAYFDFDRSGQLEQRPDYLVETVGWLTRDDEEWIEVTSERLPDDGQRAVTSIPRAVVSGDPIPLVEAS